LACGRDLLPILLVGDVFHPVGGFAVLAFVDGDVSEGGGGGGLGSKQATANAKADPYGMTSKKSKGRYRGLSTALRFGRDDTFGEGGRTKFLKCSLDCSEALFSD
jgi:hypothetical protein